LPLPIEDNLDYNNPYISSLFRKEMDDEERRLRMAVIAGAAQAIRFKEKNPRSQEDEVIRHITEKAKEILEKIDDPL
jgi:hypothetical protein